MDAEVKPWDYADAIASRIQRECHGMHVFRTGKAAEMIRANVGPLLTTLYPQGVPEGVTMEKAISELKATRGALDDCCLTETVCKTIAARLLGEKYVNGDTYYVPPLEQLMEDAVNRAEASEREAAALREAVQAICQRSAVCSIYHVGEPAGTRCLDLMKRAESGDGNYTERFRDELKHGDHLCPACVFVAEIEAALKSGATT